MRWKNLLIMIMASSSAFSAFERRGQGSPLMIFGGGLVASTENVWAHLANPAGLNTLQRRLFSASYSPQPFGLKELAYGAFSFVEPTSIGGFSVSGSRFGFELYREVTITTSFATTIADGFSAGASVSYYSLAIQDYGSASTFGVDVGGLLTVSEDVRWGFSALNLNAPAIGEARERLPQVFSTGVCYSPFEAGTLAVDLVKDIRFPLECMIGVEYAIIQPVRLRMGTSVEPSLLNAGLGVAFSFIQLDYGFSSHADIGITHQASLALLLDEL